MDSRAAEEKLKNYKWKDLMHVRTTPLKGGTFFIATAAIFAFFICLYLLIILGFHVSNSCICFQDHCTCHTSCSMKDAISEKLQLAPESAPFQPAEATKLQNILFGIGAASNVIERRKEYIKSWWRPEEMRGYVWVDEIAGNWSNTELPERKVSEDTSRFRYTHKNGKRSAIRISRIISEAFKLDLPDVHWFVMGDDDTVFVAANLVKVLSKYDHQKFYYIGSNSENHVQNVHGFSSNMAFGGGGFAISYPLAEALSKMQDDCLQRYYFLYGSDDRIQACMAELGVPLTREPGFHQFDIFGDASGMLSAHPIAPLISLHHLNVIYPLFPGMTQEQALRHLSTAIQVDPAGILQPSICYNRALNLSIQVAWGYTVLVTRGLVSPRNLELPLRTFVGWYGERDEFSFPFKTRALSQNPCENPVMFFMSDVTTTGEMGSSASHYKRDSRAAGCPSIEDAMSFLKWIHIEKQPTDDSWYRAPRRQCCRILDAKEEGFHLHVANCLEDEYVASTWH